ncbi:MAG: TrbI/VirB10 family protein [Vicinamibacterales bacterium]
MLSNRLAVLAITGISAAAAAGGGYLAVRHNAASVAAPVSEAAELGRLEAPATGFQPVQAPPAAVSTSVPAPVKAAPPSPALEPAPRVAPIRRTPVVENRQPEAAPIVVDPPEVRMVEPPVASTIPSAWTAAQPEESPFRELVVPADSVVGLRLESAVTSETAAVEDDIEARVVRDVTSGGEIAIPAGTRALGSVTVVERGGRIREQARLGIRFHTLLLPDGSEVPVSTEAIYRLGNAPGRSSAAKIGGGAVAGAILGGILGGSKGAAIGASSGAGAGTAIVYAGDRSEAVFGAGLEVTARFLSPVTVTVER